MRLTVELDGLELTKGLKFYGETNLDEKVVAQISELSIILEDVFFSLMVLKKDVDSRQEASAQDIRKRIELLENDLGVKFTFKEES